MISSSMNSWGWTAALALLMFSVTASAARPTTFEITATRTGDRALLQDLKQRCFDAYNSAGGQSAIAQRVPACSQNNFKLQPCCEQAKGVLAQGPDGCLCDAGVWSEIERQMTSSGVAGLTAENLRMFTRTCGIKNKGAGTC